MADAAGNQDTATRTVTVEDNTAPVLGLLGNAVLTRAKRYPAGWILELLHVTVSMVDVDELYQYNWRG